MQVALAALRLGAGRARAEDKVDPAVGVGALVKRGERIEAGAAWAIVHANDQRAAQEAVAMLTKAMVVGDQPPPAVELIGELIGA